MEEGGLHTVSLFISWPEMQPLTRTSTFAYGCGCVGAVGPLLGAAFVPLAEEWGVGLNDFVAGAQGGVIAAIAIGSLLFNALAVKYGKRPVYLITSIGLAVTCFWAAEARSFGNFVAARVVQGLC